MNEQPRLFLLFVVVTVYQAICHRKDEETRLQNLEDRFLQKRRRSSPDFRLGRDAQVHGKVHSFGTFQNKNMFTSDYSSNKSRIDIILFQGNQNRKTGYHHQMSS